MLQHYRLTIPQEHINHPSDERLISTTRGDFPRSLKIRLPRRQPEDNFEDDRASLVEATLNALHDYTQARRKALGRWAAFAIASILITLLAGTLLYPHLPIYFVAIQYLAITWSHTLLIANALFYQYTPSVHTVHQQNITLKPVVFYTMIGILMLSLIAMLFFVHAAYPVILQGICLVASIGMLCAYTWHTSSKQITHGVNVLKIELPFPGALKDADYIAYIRPIMRNFITRFNQNADSAKFKLGNFWNHIFVRRQNFFQMTMLPEENITATTILKFPEQGLPNPFLTTTYETTDAPNVAQWTGLDHTQFQQSATVVFYPNTALCTNRSFTLPRERWEQIELSLLGEEAQSSPYTLERNRVPDEEHTDSNQQITINLV